MPFRPKKAAAVQHLEAWRVPFDDESGDLFFLAAVLHERGRLRHHHQDVGDHAVGAPKLGAVDGVMFSVGRWGGRGRHASRVRAHLGLGQRERRNRALGETGQVFAFLLLGAEKQKRLRHANALVRGEKRRGRGAVRAHERQRAVVVDLRKPKPAISFWDLHAKGAKLGQALHDLGRYLAAAIDGVGVDFGHEKIPHAGQVGVADLAVVLALLGVGVNRRASELAHEQIGHEAGFGPVLLAGFLGDFHRFDLFAVFPFFADQCRRHKRSFSSSKATLNP